MRKAEPQLDRRRSIRTEGVSWAEATGGKEDLALPREGVWLERSGSGAGLGCYCKAVGLRLHSWKGVQTDSRNRLERASEAEQKHHQNLVRR